MRKAVLYMFLLFVFIPGSVVAYNYFFQVLDLHEIHETGAHPLDLELADFTGEGFVDVITANRDGKSLSVFLGNGDGTLVKLDDISLEKGATSLAVADFDKDQQLDVVVSLCGPACNNNEIALYRGLGNGQFEFIRKQASPGVPYNLAVGNFNNDEYLDFAASDYPNNRLLIFYGEGAWYFRQAELATGSKPIALELADLNGDGMHDLVSSDHGDGGSTIYIARSDGEFDGPDFVKTGELPYSIALEDLNIDGYHDLVVAHSTDPGSVSIFHGLGGRDFEFSENFVVRDRLVYISAADFDLDGKKDIVVTHHEKKLASLFLAGDFGFENRRVAQIEAENQIYSAQIAYMNQDKYPDLVTVDYSANTLSLSLGHEPIEQSQ